MGAQLAWGAAPGHTLHDIGSGLGFVRNSLLVDNVAKSVLHVPWAPPMKNFLHADHCTAAALHRGLVALMARPGLLRFLRVALAAVRG